MAVLPNGLETIEKGSTVWRLILNSNFTKLYTQDQVYTKTEADVLYVKQTDLTTSWQPLTLQNNWVNAGSPYEDLSCTKTAYGVVSIKGAVKDGDFSTVLATLPQGFEPAGTRRFVVDSVGGNIVVAEINTAGEIILTGTDNSLVSVEITYTI